MSQSSNPLKQYFRQPAIYLKLPSNGRFWPAGSLEMPPNQELPVFPMTAMDEISYKTPDALFNGSAIVNVVQSCIPNIKDAWKMPSIDMDSILAAIRIASYGQTLDMQTQCPGCNETSDFELNLSLLIDSAPKPDYSTAVTHGDLEIFFKPIDYQQQNNISSLQFEQQKLLQMLPDMTIPDEDKFQRMSEASAALTQLTIKVMKDSVAGIKTPQAFVSEPEFVSEFLVNCDRQLFNKIRDKAIELRESGLIKPLTMKCAHCENEYQQPINLDSTNFFGLAS